MNASCSAAAARGCAAASFFLDTITPFSVAILFRNVVGVDGNSLNVAETRFPLRTANFRLEASE